MFAYFRRPHVDLATVILRLGLGFIFIAHGYIKVSQDSSWTEVISPAMQKMVGWAELSCGGLMLLGLLTRLAALGVFVDMIGAIALVTGKRDFVVISVGPHGDRFRTGFEYNFSIIIACLALVLLGSGWLSLDHLLFVRKKEKPVGTQVAAEPTTSAAPPQPQDMVSTS